MIRISHLSKALIVALPVIALGACADEPRQSAAVSTVSTPAPAPAPARTYESERMYQRDLRK